MSFPREKILEILDRVDIERVIGRTVSLKRQGARLSGLCPFHKEKSPSFSVDPQKKLYHCFGCKAGGDVFDFVMRMETVEFPEAVRMLAREVGVELPERGESEEERRLRQEKDRLYRVNEQAQAYYEKMLWADPRALEYVQKARGLSDETVRAWHLGFAPQAWSAMSDALMARGVSEELLVRVGLSARRREQSGVYDKLRGRVVFPIAIPGEYVAGFGARRADWLVTDEAEKGPKYLNSPESPIYEKSSIFFGLAQGKDAIRKSKQAVLVEGYLDVIALHQAGIQTAIATCGTALSGRHSAMLVRLCEEVVTLYDGDTAGQDATRRAAEILLATGVSVRVAALPEADDPDTFVQRLGGDAMRKLLAEAPSAIDHAVTIAMQRHAGAGVAGTVKIVEEVRPLLMAVKDPLQRDLYIDGSARRIGIDGRMLRQHLVKPNRGRHEGPDSGGPGGSQAPRPAPPPRPPEPIRREPPTKVELAVLRHLVEAPDTTLKTLESKRALGAFHHSTIRATVSAAWAAWRAGTALDVSRVLEAARDQGVADEGTMRLIRETLMDPLPRANDLEDCLENLLRSDKQRTLRDLKARIKRETDPEALERLNTELAAVLRS